MAGNYVACKKSMFSVSCVSSPQVNTCLKITIKTIEQGLYVQVLQYYLRKGRWTLFLCVYGRRAKLSRKMSKWRFRLKPPTHTWKQIFFLLWNILHEYHWNQINCKGPTYYAIVTLFDQNRKNYNQSNKNLHLFSHMAVPAAPLMVQLNVWILFQEVLIGMCNF